MKDVMAIINLMEDDNFLKEISYHRPQAAVPFGGRYRLVDFILSNIVNSGIKNVGILVQHKYRSLMDHLGRGKEWDLDRKRDGLFFLPPADFTAPVTNKWDLQYFHSHLDYINNSRQKYVLIAGYHMVCNIDFNEAFLFHKTMNADITIIYKEVDPTKTDLTQCYTLETSQDGRITDFEVKPQKTQSTKIALEICLMEKSLLVDLINRGYSRGDSDLVRDGFIKNLNRLRIYGYPHQGYLANINSVQSYYQHHMDLLQPNISRELFFAKGLIYTKGKDGPPTKYTSSAKVKNSLIANGCIIEGQVENSIIFRGVKVGKGAMVKNSIIMQQCTLESDIYLEHVITDKKVVITKGKHLKGDKHYPLVIRKHAVI